MDNKTHFINPNDTANSRLHQLIRQWLQDKLSLEEPWDLNISEIKCNDPGCLHTDTYFTVVKDGESRRFLVSKPLVYIRKWDMDALKELSRPS